MYQFNDGCCSECFFEWLVGSYMLACLIIFQKALKIIFVSDGCR